MASIYFRVALPRAQKVARRENAETMLTFRNEGVADSIVPHRDSSWTWARLAASRPAGRALFLTPA